MVGDRCERCWGRNGLEPFVPEGMHPVTLCRSCRQEAPREPLVFREVFMRFSSAKEMISHYDARDEGEALRKLCVERRLDYKAVTRAIDSHGLPTGTRFLDFTRPYGYELRDGGLAVKPEEAKTVGVIFEMYVKGMGIAKICKELNGAKIPTKTGKEWASQTIANILRNPLYAGFVRDKGDTLRPGRHRRIVDPEQFSDVQVAMERRIRRPDQRHESRLFRGDVRRSGGEERSTVLPASRLDKRSRT